MSKLIMTFRIFSLYDLMKYLCNIEERKFLNMVCFLQQLYIPERILSDKINISGL